MKMKKHVQSEKERAFQEEAALKREHKRAEKARNGRKTAIVMLLVGCGFFAVFLVFFVLNVAKMHNYETNYIRTYGVVTDFKVHHVTNPKKTNHYTPVFVYSYGGETYTATDWESYPARIQEMIGESVEIYVDPANPEHAARTDTADGFSVMATIPFAGALIAFSIGGICLVGLKGGGYVKRILFVWLPEIVLCFAFILLFATGLPHDGIAAVYSRVRGALWLTVFAGIVFAVAALDGFIVLKCRPPDIDSRAKAYKKMQE